ncbi:hypothetical protein VUR80DRAFT_6334 [Thermomyces stellatus]
MSPRRLASALAMGLTPAEAPGDTSPPVSPQLISRGLASALRRCADAAFRAAADVFDRKGKGCSATTQTQGSDQGVADALESRVCRSLPRLSRSALLGTMRRGQRAVLVKRRNKVHADAPVIRTTDRRRARASPLRGRLRGGTLDWPAGQIAGISTWIRHMKFARMT